ncbi:MAG: caspase family protein [Pseudomonadota bacterium]|nr:caspase family protein [Pseudomonadota bacterium]
MRAPKGFQLTARGICIGFFTVILGACASNPAPSASGPDAEVKNADDLLIIDCLLPGQVKKLGTQTTFLTARRPIKTTATDCEIRGGEYVAFDRADYATALKIWLPVAQAGDAEAQTYVGEIYEKGLGLKPDYQAASIWYEKAAKQNFSRALINLGNLYEKGLGVAQDKAMALNLYRQAAGLQSDDLLYASTVEVRAVDQKELIRLKDEVAFKSQQLQAAEGKLANLQLELGQRKQALAAAEKNQKNAELALFAQESKAIHEQSQALIKQLRSELDSAKLEVSSQQQQLAQANQQLQQINSEVSTANNSILQSETLIASADSMPVIEIIDPPMTLMRGLPTIPVKASITEKEIVGKIKAPKGLKSFKVNGKEQTIDEYNLFWVNVPLDGSRQTVKLEAVDAQNNKVAFNFSVVPDHQTAVSSTAKPADPTPLAVKSGINLGRYYALVIGNNEYRNYPELKTAVNDATETAALLEQKFGFKTTVLKNATRYEILAAMNQLRETLTEQDNLLIYYAGHGELDDKTEKGFWLPVDAEQGNPRNWISNAAISDILNTLKAKHVMVVADSCYAGTLSVAAMPRVDESMPEDLQKEWIMAMSQARARTVLTSGGIAPVLDGGGDGHSVFSRAFIETLRSSNGIIEGHSIYREVLSRVQSKAKALNVQQVPEYAPARYAGHEAGEFFFSSGSTI